jgi:TPR repeat protein
VCPRELRQQRRQLLHMPRGMAHQQKVREYMSPKIKYTLLSVLLPLIFFVTSLLAIAQATDIQGKVVMVWGRIVKIEINSKFLPRTGDDVTIGFKVPDIGFVPLKGSWYVIKVSERSVTAEPKGDSVLPQVGQIATIHSSNPQSLDSFLARPEVVYERGNDYYYGRKGHTQDYKKAAALFRKAAEQGNAEAQNGLGVMYAKGLGVAQDYVQAVSWYRKAAEQGNATSQRNLGNKYYEGKGVTQDYAKAAFWYRKAAEQENASAQNNLGCMYERGIGVTQDYAQAVSWYRKAAEQGFVEGMANLGVMYANGRGVKKDEAKAVYWYQKAAEQGYASAQYYLGNRNFEGRGVEKDYANAVYWYRKAAEQGHADAQTRLKELGLSW